MALIKTRNLLDQGAQNTRLSNPEVAGTTVSRVDNTTGLVTGWGVQFGATGNEDTEVAIGTPATGSTITHSALSKNHPEDTPVFFIKYNQVVFERSTDGTTGTATPMSGGTVTYQADSPFTAFDDTTGSSAYGYRTYFRNSALSVNSIESDWITFAGHSFYSLAKIRDRARNKLWDASFVNDEMLDEWINEWKDEMTNAVIQTNEDYALGTVNVPFGTNGLGTITTTDFSQVRRVWITYNGQDRFQSTKMNVNDFYPDEIFTSTHPAHYFQGDNVLGVKPEVGGGTAELVFYRFGTTMVNDTDELPLPMRPYTKSFTDYVVAQALYKDEKDSSADRRMTMAMQAKMDFLSDLAPRDKSGPTMIDIVEPIANDSGDVY